NLLHGGEEETDEDGDDGDHHQQLNQREPAARSAAIRPAEKALHDCTLKRGRKQRKNEPFVFVFDPVCNFNRNSPKLHVNRVVSIPFCGRPWSVGSHEPMEPPATAPPGERPFAGRREPVRPSRTGGRSVPESTEYSSPARSVPAIIRTREDRVR